MAIKIRKWLARWSKAESGKEREDEARVLDQDEVRVSAEEEAPGVSPDEVLADDESSVLLEDEAPVLRRDEPRVTTQYNVRFIVVDEAAVASEDEILDIGEAEAHVPAEGEASLIPEYEALVPLVDDVFVPTADAAPGSAQDEVQVIVEHEAPVVALDEASGPIREDAKEKQELGRRKHPRIVVKEEAKGRVAAVSDAVLLNISLGGALIEHVGVVRPGTPSSLELDLHGKRIRLRCRVARSVGNRIEVQPDGEQELIYHTGLQFVEPSDETLQVIGDYIQSLSNEG
ncbi:MAG: PilZ domain-containing protein [candidate division NC10 bacterium]